MKISFLLLVFSVLNAYGTSIFSQNAIISVDMQNATVREVVREIERQGEIKFLFNDNLAGLNTRVDVTFTDHPIKNVLTAALGQVDLMYEEIKEDFLVLLPKPVDTQQQQSVRGTVTDENEDPLPGASILVEGTSTGTVTGIDGNYSLTVPQGNNILVISYVGYSQQRIEIGGRTIVNIQLQPSAAELREVVVTALGILREERSLGVSVGSVAGEELARNPDLNVANSLVGRISGIQVDQSGGPDGSTRVLIRGFSSLQGGNEPLYVVDGVPIDNSRRISAGRWGGRDGGDGIQNINPNDIESISVLKGANAAALYGERGANGVILITTKVGSAREGIGVEVNSRTTVGRPMVMPDLQNVYGAGINGAHRFFSDGQGNIYSKQQADELGITNQLIPQVTTLRDGPQHPLNWGPEMDGHQVYQFDGQLLPFSPQPDNVNDFFQDQMTTDNSISFSGGSETTTFRLSVGNIRYQGIQPTNTMNRNTINLRGTHRLGERLTAEGRINYVGQQVVNRPGLSDDQRNIGYQFRGMPRNTYHDSFVRYELTQEDLDNPNALHAYLPVQRVVDWSRHWSNGTHTENPYWVINNVRNQDSRDRVMGFVNLGYQFTNWLNASLRAGTDFYTDDIHVHDAIGTRVRQIGYVQDFTTQSREDNVQLLMTGNRRLTENFEVSASLGGNWMRTNYRNVGHSGTNLSVPDLHIIGNAVNQSVSYGVSEREIQSAYAFGQFNMFDFWYVDWTARNDWSSTLPPHDNSFFYPSLSSNLVFTDAFNISSDLLSYGSVRAAWAQAGNSAGAYQIYGGYGLAANPLHGVPGAGFSGRIPLYDLKSELSTSWEFGTDLRLFRGRLRFDATYYDAVTSNQILNIAVAPSSGFGTRTVNAGEIRNWGAEFLLSTDVLRRENLFWDVSVNWSANRNEVVELVEGIDRFQLGISRNVRVYADPGQPYGAIYTDVGRWVRDDKGNRIIDSNGLPVSETGEFMIGNVMPKWIGGISTSLDYRGFSIYALFDGRYGGDIFSISNVYEALYGTTKRTVEGRDGTYVAEGVLGVQDENGNWVSTGEKNNIQVSAQDYWKRVVPAQAQAVGDEFITDATYIKLKDLRIGYNIPASFTQRFGIQQLNVALVGQNLFYLLRYTDGFSPETASFNLGREGIGIEAFSWPQIRSVGINLRVAL